MKALKQVLIGAGLALSVASASQAQNALPVSPQKLALAQRVVEAQGQQRNTEAMTAIVAQQLNAAFSATAISPDDKQFMIQVLKEEVKKLQDQVLPQTARVYAETFTDGELSDLLAFYNSPSGRAYIAKIPEVLNRQNALILPLLPPMQAQVVTRFLDHVCAEHKCTPAQRKMLQDMQQKASSTAHSAR